MKVFLARIAVLLIVMIACSAYLGSFSRKTVDPKMQENQSIATWLLRTLNLKELAVGFLWLRFDNDTVYLLGNYHRLLITLDAITALKPDEFDAWSLKNFMRVDRGRRKKDAEITSRALRDFELSCRLNPDDWRFWHDAAQTIYARLDDPEKALEFARKAYSLPDHQVKTPRLLALICYDLKKYDEALKVYQSIWENASATASEKKIASRMIEDIKKKTP